MDEFERIAEIQKLLGANAPGVLLGIGDDGAVLERPQGPIVISVDAAVEGVHFRRDFAPLRTIGRRATVAALSDLAAMGAAPLAMVANLQLPANFLDSELRELVLGQADAAKEFVVPMVGGNLSSGQDLAITTTVLGTAMPVCLRRDGAREGELLYCSGPVGGAALGLLFCLQNLQNRPQAAPFVDAFLRPTAHIAVGQALCGVATACVDVSDGVLQDLSHLCSASGVGAEIDLAALPTLPGFWFAAAELEADPQKLLLQGGDDYVLLFTAPADLAVPGNHPAIGRITPKTEGIRVLAATGEVLQGPFHGFRHFPHP